MNCIELDLGKINEIEEVEGLNSPLDLLICMPIFIKTDRRKFRVAHVLILSTQRTPNS